MPIPFNMLPIFLMFVSYFYRMTEGVLSYYYCIASHARMANQKKIESFRSKLSEVVNQYSTIDLLKIYVQINRLRQF